uniref:Ovule protein n=1 Tax=Romanomermis culicivorax TaxID=13658 RepID=A0A915J299_ROMCU
MLMAVSVWQCNVCLGSHHTNTILVIFCIGQFWLPSLSMYKIGGKSHLQFLGLKISRRSSPIKT